MRAYTAGSAYAEGQDAVKGTLEPGKLADLVVLSDDIFAIDPAAIEGVRVDATLLGGEVVFKRNAVPDNPFPATPSRGQIARRTAPWAAGSGPPSPPSPTGRTQPPEPPDRDDAQTSPARLPKMKH